MRLGLQGKAEPLTAALSQQSALPQLQAIAGGSSGAAAAAQPQPAATAAQTQQGLPGFPPQAAPQTVPNGDLVWVGLGGSSGQTSTKA